MGGGEGREEREGGRGSERQGKEGVRVTKMIPALSSVGVLVMMVAIGLADPKSAMTYS